MMDLLGHHLVHWDTGRLNVTACGTQTAAVKSGGYPGSNRSEEPLRW